MKENKKILKNINTDKIDFLIVLCPSESRTLDNKYAYYEIDHDKREKERSIYLGGQIRMRAAVDLAPRVHTYIVVGGSRVKVDDMKGYLEQELGPDNVHPVIRVVSKADTTGNLMAIYKCREKYKKDKDKDFLAGKTVGVLTNFYHLPRAWRFASFILKDINFIPIAAESVISRYHTTYTLYRQEFLFRVVREIEGLHDWENKIYKNQEEIEKFEWKKWTGDIPDADKQYLG